MVSKWNRVDELEAIAREGAVVVIKIDGGRRSDPNIFTVVLSGGTLGPEEFFRSDGGNLDELIARAIDFYRKE
jgi:hypothetical protein